MANIFGIDFTEKNQIQTVEYISDLIENHRTDDIPKHIITANHEFLMRSEKDKKIFKLMRSADMVTPDGIGVVIAAKLFKENLKERVTGCDTVVGLFEKHEKERKPIKVFMFGAKKEILKKAVFNIEQKYNCVKVVGMQDGYFQENDESKIIKGINRSKADLLLVALGFPKQDQFIYDNKAKLNVKVAIGVGGRFDVLSGNSKRAPEIVQKANLEWLYRLLKKPKRIFRQVSLFKFAVVVLYRKVTRNY